jgi:hypothetical protein
VLRNQVNDKAQFNLLTEGSEKQFTVVESVIILSLHGMFQLKSQKKVFVLWQQTSTGIWSIVSGKLGFEF